MLTRCPQCFAWFRVRAEHLSVAKGLVTCGRCEHVFNALESLLEESAAPPPAPPRIDAPPPDTAPVLAAAPEPEPEPQPVAPTTAATPPAPLRFVTVSATPTLAPSREVARASRLVTGAAVAAPFAGDVTPSQPAPPPRAAALTFKSIGATPTVAPAPAGGAPSQPVTGAVSAAPLALAAATGGHEPLDLPRVQHGAAYTADTPPRISRHDDLDAAAPPRVLHADPFDAPDAEPPPDDEDLDLDALPSFQPSADLGALETPPDLALDDGFDGQEPPRVVLSDDFDEPAEREPPEEDLDIGPVSTRPDDIDIADFDFAAIDDDDPLAPAAEAPPAVEAAAEEEDEDHTDPKALAHLRAEPAPAPTGTPLDLRPLPLDPDYVPPAAVDAGTDEDERDHTDPHALERLRAAEAAPTPRIDLDAVVDEPPVPAVLADDLAALAAPPRSTSWRALAWSAFAFLLALAAVLQAAFMERQAVVAALPEAGPAIDFLCARLPCLERRPQASTVRLLARDVREHPSYRDALLVNATIVNDGKTPTPYPVIDLRLRDAAGNVLSARRFQPREYLDQSIAIDEGMPPGRPVYIVLELAGNASNAVSFEFTFL